MAQRGKRKARAARVPISDEELIGRLQDQAPDVLQATVSEADFDAVVEELLKESSPEIRHFYCRKCGEYHQKTHPHYRPEPP